MMSDQYIMVITTTSNKEDAEKITRHLLEKRLAACIQIIDSISSYYWWQDKINCDQEWLCLIKSHQSVYDLLEKTIIEIHPYEVPEIIALPIVSESNNYLKWLGNQLVNPSLF
ncbi:divalent-cation tolerance protein CutA [Aphanothece sacrum]|uniref:Periplasmic divalent cation tolerance protein CutA n=1 Tax=Aphanothece sacrum FPU1 TaxID=1920663 RepID=A0A401IKU0_APHSA|nr:divalent-cation tolerance protein CutA [Aphanothece sacrum]GBF81861.1 periplasmic divalent cation tolerance protein CutA [Aphanothece sacrum FPU1]GBF85680.1 periplasmic divalent cation tolerance protein CutA [Aphanothece sacrum FPU3]